MIVVVVDTSVIVVGCMEIDVSFLILMDIFVVVVGTRTDIIFESVTVSLRRLTLVDTKVIVVGTIDIMRLTRVETVDKVTRSVSVTVLFDPDLKMILVVVKMDVNVVGSVSV